MNYVRRAASVTICIAALSVPTLLEAKNYPAAKALAAQLKPLGLTPKADPGGLGRVSAQIRTILGHMEKSQVEGGPGAEDLVDTAYDMFRPDVGPVHRTAATGALVEMWRTARVLGAFDGDQKFTGKITTGPEQGQPLVFEYIVPVTEAPAFSRDVANVRLVSPSKKRVDAAALTPREQAYQATLKAIDREVSGMKTLAKIEDGGPRNSVGQTKEEEARLWKEAMEKSGDAAKELPDIHITCRMLATPSNRTEDKWKIGAEITNLSHHPTEVEVECVIIGTTDKYRINYVMGEKKVKLQLRGGQVSDMEFLSTLREGDYRNRTADFEKLDKKERPKNRVFYRGTIFRVHHAKGIAGMAATDPSLLSLFEEEGDPTLADLPKLYTDPKTWPKLAIESDSAK
ncbi:hypothetical protein DES53_106278 [Roseimicrobium gellanilyticum]|uniref:Uncharacterized protein n=1 Tax=Roseimicrobium gellanilyticum TaxID=748857 RepID=A0A366HKL5_9BACT|nr:hypothetical protein [Roseimicrobium gellanilyticum]RBP42569.1 hypothetical protein DES53_106278 [Roseimicrobium gellanilyticum]